MLVALVTAALLAAGLAALHRARAPREAPPPEAPPATQPYRSLPQGAGPPQEDPHIPLEAALATFEREPANTTALDVVRVLARRSGNLLVLRDALHRALETLAADRDDLRLRYHRELARLYAGDLSDSEMAIESLEAVVALSPGDLRLVEQLVEQYRRLGRHTEVLDLYVRQATLAQSTRDPGAAARWLRLAADVAEYQCLRPAHAELLRRRARDLEPG